MNFLAKIKNVEKNYYYIFKKVIVPDIKEKSLSLYEKISAWNLGFSARRMKIFKINENNINSFMPDFDYFKLHPVNGYYSNWIDDKLSYYFLLAPYREFLPKYYCHIDGKLIKKMPDWQIKHNADKEKLLILLKQEKNLVAKQVSGSLGKGFYKMSFINNGFYVNNDLMNKKKFLAFLEGLDGYIITEYVNSHEEIKKIYSNTPNTLRVQLIRDGGKLPEITGSFMRFGTEVSGLLETTAAGTIFTEVNLNTGKLSNANKLNELSINSFDKHPDTDEKLNIELPNWNLVKSKLIEISNYLPQLCYLGFDIVITNEGFKILEINSLSALTFLSCYCPIFENEYSKEFFIRKLKENKKRHKKLLKRLKKAEEEKGEL